MRLFLADIDEQTLEKTATELRQMGAEVLSFAVDVSLESGVDTMIDQAMAHYGQIDLLINNAGVIMPGSVLDVPAKDWEWVFQVNCMSQVYAVKRVIPIMEGQGTPCYIVNVSSAAGLVTSGQMPAYSATKHFSVSLTESVSMALQEKNSNVSISVFVPALLRPICTILTSIARSDIRIRRIPTIPVRLTGSI
jgi:short-subunit dehydrogenase